MITEQIDPEACSCWRCHADCLGRWIEERAGWSRILPFEQGAAYYISRYIGRDANRCDWYPRVGEEPSPTMRRSAEIGRLDMVHSADLPRHFFKQSYKERKR